MGLPSSPRGVIAAPAAHPLPSPTTPTLCAAVILTRACLPLGPLLLRTGFPSLSWSFQMIHKMTLSNSSLSSPAMTLRSTTVLSGDGTEKPSVLDASQAPKVAPAEAASPDAWLPLALTLLDLCRSAEWSGRMEYPCDAPGFAIGAGAWIKVKGAAGHSAGLKSGKAKAATPKPDAAGHDLDTILDEVSRAAHGDEESAPIRDAMDAIHDMDVFDDLDSAEPPAAIWRPYPWTLLAALRLARTFGDVDAFLTRLTTPGRIVLLQTGQIALDETVEQMMNTALRSRAFVAHMPDLPTILRANSAVGSDTLKRYRPLAGLSDSARDAVLEGGALVIIAPVGALLPKALRNLRPDVVTLAPLDADILRALLALRYDDETSVAGLELSGLHYLSRLSVDDLMLALRAPDAGGAVADIRAALSPARTSVGTLADFPLPAEVRKTVDQMITDLRAWSDGALPWSDVTRGLLLAGPPGCGKTELARLIGREAGLSVIAGSVGQWSAESSRSSEMIKAMRGAFTQAAEQAPAILFIDELDAFGDRTRAPDQNTAYTDFIVTALLDLMDGFEGREGVVIMGATNHIWKIDAAIRRPGRFDTVLHLSHPTHEMMPQALRWQLGPDLPDADLSAIAKAAFGLSGADIAALVRSARAAARAQRRPMCEADLMDAITALRPPLAPALRWRVAVHEAGHAIVATATSGARPSMLSIESSGGGMRARLAETMNTRAALETRIAIGLAGRAAEVLILGAPSGGAGGDEDSDLAKVTRIASALEDSLGLGETLIYFSPDDRATDRLRFDAPHRKIVEGHLSRGNARATRILEGNRTQLIALATALDTEGILKGDALDQLLSAVIPEVGGDTATSAPMVPAEDVAERDSAGRLSVDTAPGTSQSPAANSDTTEGASSDPTSARVHL